MGESLLVRSAAPLGSGILKIRRAKATAVMKRLALVHWNRSETASFVSRLERLGYHVDNVALAGPELLRALRENPPDGIVIDLSRLPSHGKAVAVALRGSKSTRLVPIVFVDGDPEKVRKVKELLPDARYTHWALAGPVLEHAISHPPKEVIVPGAMDNYLSSPLPKKLGISPHSSIILLSAPPGFEDSLGALPEGVVLHRKPKSGAKGKLVLLFVRSIRELEQKFPDSLRHLAEQGALWIAWPKKTSAIASDLTQQWVRTYGMAHGLVDYKICAIDATWSGLRFARRRT